MHPITPAILLNFRFTFRTSLRVQLQPNIGLLIDLLLTGLEGPASHSCMLLHLARYAIIDPAFLATENLLVADVKAIEANRLRALEVIWILPTEVSGVPSNSQLKEVPAMREWIEMLTASKSSRPRDDSH